MRKMKLANAATGVANGNACVFRSTKPALTIGIVPSTMKTMKETKYPCTGRKYGQEPIIQKFVTRPGFATSVPVRIRKLCIPVAIMFGTVSHAINSTLTIIRHARAMFGVVGNATVRMLWRIIVRICTIGIAKPAIRCITRTMRARKRRSGIVLPVMRTA